MGSFLTFRNIVILAVVGILAVAIPVTLRLAQQQQDLRSRAAGPSISTSSTQLTNSGSGYPIISISVSVDSNISWNVHYCTTGTNCTGLLNWFAIPGGSGTGNNTVTYTFPSSESGTHTIALFDGNNVTQLASTTITFQTTSGGGGGSSCTVPSAPAGLNFISSTNTISWNAVSGATSYNARVHDLNINKEYDYDGISNTWYTLPASILVGGHSYSWWVHAVNSCGGSQPATGSNFTISGSSPGDTGGTSSPINEVPSTCKTSQTCTGLGQDTSCPSGSQWCYDGFCINDNYDPATKTCPPSGGNTTCISPGPVRNLRPADGTQYPAGKRTVTLQWDAPATGGPLAHYDVRLDDPTTTGAGKEPDVVVDNYSSTSLQIPDLENPTAYFWWVDAVSSCGAAESRASASFSIAGGNINIPYIIEGNVLNEKTNPVGGAKVCLDPPSGDTTCSTPGLLKSTTSSTDQPGLISGRYHIENVPPANSGHNVFISPPQGYTVTSANPVLVNQGGISQNKEVDFELSSPAGVTPTPTPQSGATPTPTPTPQSGATPTPTPAPGQEGTLCYFVTENLLERNSFNSCSDERAQPYTDHPTKLVDTFEDKTAGVKTIFVRFISNTGQKIDVQKSIKYDPKPALTNILCTYSPTREGTIIAITGTNLGTHTQQGSGGLFVKGQKTPTIWSATTQQPITVQVPQRLEGEIPIILRNDNKDEVVGSCSVGLSTISFTTNIQCRKPGNFSAEDVLVKIFENLKVPAGTIPLPIISQKINLDSDGVPVEFNPKLEANKIYIMIIKTHQGIARRVAFTALPGTTVLPFPILIPVGDIAPPSLPDGQINALDNSLMIREWSLLLDVERASDLNLDKRVNSVDYSCLLLNARPETNKDEVYKPVDIQKPSTSTPTPSPTVSPTPTGQSCTNPISCATTLTISANHTTPVVGGRVTFQGELTGFDGHPIPGQVIKIINVDTNTILSDSTQLNNQGTHNTDLNGGYLILLPISSSTELNVIAKFDGDGSNEPSQSQPVKISPSSTL